MNFLSLIRTDGFCSANLIFFISAIPILTQMLEVFPIPDFSNTLVSLPDVGHLYL